MLIKQNGIKITSQQVEEDTPRAPAEKHGNERSEQYRVTSFHSQRKNWSSEHFTNIALWRESTGLDAREPESSRAQ